MEEFRARRSKLAAHLPNNSIALVCGAQLKLRNGDAEYPFRQDSDFYYLTGFKEPSAVMALCKDIDGKLTFVLFNRANDPHMEIWTGERAGQIGACKDFGADEAYDITKIDSVMSRLIAHRQTLYFPFNVHKEFEQQILTWLRDAKRNARESSDRQSAILAPDTLIDLLPLIHEMRLFKSEYEIACMRKAAEVSAQGHDLLIRSCQAEQMEYQLEALFNAHCLQAGCRGLAYNSIVAGGNNACTLHYIENDQALQAGDLVLIDAGAEYDYYAADITRTFPVSGKFSREQRQIYELVLQAQLAGIEQVRPGNLWDRVQEVMVKIIVTGLVDLGIMSGDVKQLIQDKEYNKFYMHSSGHWLGLDVHDAGKYKLHGKWRPFAPGMVLTVEPGIYIKDDMQGIDPKWLGIGVRIEEIF